MFGISNYFANISNTRYPQTMNMTHSMQSFKHNPQTTIRKPEDIIKWSRPSINEEILQNDGTIDINYTESLPMWFNRTPNHYNYSIKPNGAISSDGGTNIYATNDEAKKLISELRTKLKNKSDKESIRKLAAEIDKTLVMQPKYKISETTASVVGPSNATGPYYQSVVCDFDTSVIQKKKIISVIDPCQSGQCTTYSIVLDNNGIPSECVLKKEKWNKCSIKPSYTSMTCQDFPNDKKDKFQTIMNSYKNKELTYEALNGFLQQTFLPPQ